MTEHGEVGMGRWRGGTTIVLLVLLGSIACEGSDTPPDGASPADGAASGADAASDAGANDAGPSAHECDALRGDLQTVLDEATTHDAIPSSPEVLAAAAALYRLEQRERVTDLVIEGLETILADSTDPVHATPDGAAYLRGVVDAQRAELMTARAALTDARARAPDDLLRETDGATRVLDAVMWRVIAGQVMNVLDRCATDRPSLADGEVEDLVHDLHMILGDAHEGHGVAREDIVASLLAGGAP